MWPRVSRGRSAIVCVVSTDDQVTAALRSDPLDAFGELLAHVGLERLRAQWLVTLAKLHELEAAASAETTILSADLVVSALAFLVAHARRLGVGPFTGTSFDGLAAAWKIDDILDSAVVGGDAAVIDETTRRRVDELLETRRRIRAAQQPNDLGPLELPPELTSQARRTAELVVQRILAWLHNYAPADV